MSGPLLIQTVGTGGPRNPVWEALAFSVRTLRPSLLVQLCSTLTANETIPKFLADVGDRCPRREQHTCKDEQDVQALVLEYAAIIDDLRARHPTARIEADFTSGTKAMSAAIVAACVSRGISRLHYAIGPRDAGGRATSTSRLVSLEAAAITAEHALQELGRLFNLHQFLAVREQAGSLAASLGDARQQARARSLEMMADAYDHWDRFDWRGAAAGLQDALKLDQLAAAGWSLEHIERQGRFVNLCHAKPAHPARALDLLLNARRCADNGYFDDAAARCYRLIELILQQRLHDRGITETRGVSTTTLRKLGAAAFADELERYGKFKLNLNLSDCSWALQQMGDPVGKWLDAGLGNNTRKGKLRQALDVRNASFLAHGDKPIDARAVEQLFDWAGEALKRAFAARTCANPFDDLDAARDAAQFLACPWTPSQRPR